MSREKALSILDDPVRPSQRRVLGISRVLYTARRKFCSEGGEDGDLERRCGIMARGGVEVTNLRVIPIKRM